jgi:uncharacterized protein
MPPKTSRPGRPTLGAAKRTRLSMSLRPDLLARVVKHAQRADLPLSRATEDLLEAALKAQDFQASLWEARLGRSAAQVASLCKAIGIKKLSLFGSILTDRFRPDSDVDLLVEFKPGVIETLLDKAHVLVQFEDAFSRRVDLTEPRLLDNPIRRREILNSAKLVYAS